MVFGLLSIISIPTVTGISLGASEQRKRNRRRDDEKRMAKFFMDVYCDGQKEVVQKLNGQRVVLRNNKAYLDHADPSLRTHSSHTAQAFYIAYPDESRKRGDGLVSSVSDDPPMLNWLYVDKDTMEVKYGNRTQSIEHIVGPWDWTEGDDEEVGVVLERAEAFAAVEEEEDVWALYYDRYDEGLAGYVDSGKRVIPVSIDRTLVEPSQQNR